MMTRLLPLPLAIALLIITVSTAYAAGDQVGIPQGLSLPWAGLSVLASVASGVIASQISVRVAVAVMKERLDGVGRTLKRHEGEIRSVQGQVQQLRTDASGQVQMLRTEVTGDVSLIREHCAAQHGGDIHKVRT